MTIQHAPLFLAAGLVLAVAQPVVGVAEPVAISLQDDSPDSVIAEWEARLDSFRKSYDRAKPEHRAEMKWPTADKFVPRVRAATEGDLASSAGERGLVWLIVNAPQDDVTWALDQLLTLHPASDSFGSVVYAIGGRPSRVAALDQIRATSKDRATVGAATYFAALSRIHAVEQAATLELSEDVAADEKLTPAARDALRDEARGLLNDVVAHYGAYELYGDQPLDKIASNELYLLDHLAIGCEAPEIEGEDMDGVPFKLSDYRGQVLVLDFWGDW